MSTTFDFVTAGSFPAVASLVDNAAGALLAFVAKSNGGFVHAHRLDAPIGH
jgi:hypothetical protein